VGHSDVRLIGAAEACGYEARPSCRTPTLKATDSSRPPMHVSHRHSRLRRSWPAPPAAEGDDEPAAWFASLNAPFLWTMGRIGSTMPAIHCLVSHRECVCRRAGRVSASAARGAFTTRRACAAAACVSPIHTRAGSVSPGTNTRCTAQLANTATSRSNSVVITVHATLSLSAYRDGPRRYHFQGRNLPRRAGQLITLYRLDSRGREIRTAVAKAGTTGLWRIDRQFTGSAQFRFVARIGATQINGAGKSNVRRTIIH
jgi:hypothetical protein